MVAITVSRPSGGIDVTSRNPKATLYVSSDPGAVPITRESSPNGTTRFSKDPSENFVVVEKKTGINTWNTTGMQFSGGSIGLGRNLILEGAAHFLKTENSEGTDHHAAALVPHIPISDEGSGFTHAPVLNVLQTDVIFTDATGQVGFMPDMLEFAAVDRINLQIQFG